MDYVATLLNCVDYKTVRRILNDKVRGVCREAVVACFKVLSQILSGGTEADQEKPSVRIIISWPSFKPGASRTRRTLRHYTATSI